MPSLQELQVQVHTCVGTSVTLGSRAWEHLAACTQLARLRLAEGYVDDGADEPGESHACLWPLPCLMACTACGVHAAPNSSVRAHCARSSAPTRRRAICHAFPSAGCFELLPGATRLTALREFEVHGNVSSLGDLWQHTGLTRLVLQDSIDAFPEAPQDGGSLPALLQADLGSEQGELELPEQCRLFAALSNVTRLVRLLAHFFLGCWSWQ